MTSGSGLPDDVTLKLIAQVARLEGEMANLSAQVKEIRADTKALLATLNSVKGGWRVLVIISGIAGGMVGFAVNWFMAES